MSRPKLLPRDVRENCLALVKGYERRKREYEIRREAALYSTGSNVVTIQDAEEPDDYTKDVGVMLPGSHNSSRRTEDLTMKLQDLEDQLETKRMRAVEYALNLVGLDLPKEQRERLTRAIFISCTQGRKYPFERLGIEGMERSCFYDRRLKFLLHIAKYMEMI